ncbi:hypothetical protein RHMOL_Rhmol11G0007800 [Rhododendron molle]|uniref:Uncharacterized protein n=1 Tax=Rhododendron molle TaxID=49168 RepID=A0ACC0LNX4_RHOML|nr:hypothetical protein RHMOL_Rhmol11G0007800 [Rhododendron molle]
MHELLASMSTKPHPSEKEMSDTSAATGLAMLMHPIQLTMGTIVCQEFTPSYADIDGRLVTVEDSVKANLTLPITPLQGLALPKDMKKVPQELTPSLVDMYSHLVQAVTFS